MFRPAARGGNALHARCNGATSMTDDVAARAVAQEGLRYIQDAVPALLESNPDGLRNAQIADSLGLRSSIRDGANEIT